MLTTDPMPYQSANISILKIVVCLDFGATFAAQLLIREIKCEIQSAGT